MNKWTNCALAIALATSSTLAFAQTATSPSFDFISGGYLSADYEDESVNGLTASFSQSFGNDWFVTADYMTASEDYEEALMDDIIYRAKAEISRLYGNVGYKFYNEGNTTAYISGGLAWVEAVIKTDTFGDFGADETGWNLKVGVRNRFTDSLEVDASIRHYDVGNMDSQEISVAGRYFINSNVSVGLGYSIVSSEENHTFLTASYHW
ncbi:porin family protein [Pseudidiomarina marina]|uniref:outer membrane protein n=1 Tax=Pseudidiomarina marina TaxID=502366 RepID=UPI00384A58A0